MNSYLRVIARYFDFTGRTGRSDFWWYSAITGLIWIALFIMYRGRATWAEVAFIVFSLLHILPTLAVDARRLRDAGRSAWWTFLIVVPFGVFVLIGFWLLPTASTESQARTGQRDEPTFGPPTRNPADQIAELEKLAALRASGAIDEQEFREMKARLMRGATAQ